MDCYPPWVLEQPLCYCSVTFCDYCGEPMTSRSWPECKSIGNPAGHAEIMEPREA